MRIKKETTKHLGKRALALFLSLVMCTSMLQISAFAYSNQVMDGYFTVDENGEVALAESGASSVTEGGYTLSKTIKQTDGNAFEITLEVKTSQSVTTSHSKTATVLVIDLSNSMDNPLSNNKSRLDAAKQVAKDFLKSYAGTDELAEQKLSIVWFGTESGVDQNWVNVAGGQGKNSYDRVYNYLNNLTVPHRGDSGGTNLDAGLETALGQLNKISDPNMQKNVVLLTDGKPTYHLYIGRDTRVHLGGNGQNGSKENNDAAKEEATAIKNTDATLYTVCLAAENEVCYEVSNNKCVNCSKGKYEHNWVELCEHCGKAKEDHVQHEFWDWVFYVCADGEYYSGKDFYFCDNTHTTQYSKNVTVGNFLRNDIATSASTAFNANTASELEQALKAIAAKIESEGSTGEGTTVTDPMGDFIVLGDVSGLTDVSVEGKVLTWTLEPTRAAQSTSGNTTTYTYSVTYPITLDTSAKSFQEKNEDGSVKYYPTNGYTYLSVPQADGTSKQIAFLVPGVNGKIPEYNYTVKFFKQGGANRGEYDKYEEVTEDTVTIGPVDLHTEVSVTDVSTNYKTKYTGDHYHYAYGAPVSMKITADESENVIKLYYDKDTTSVTVNHFYKTNTWSADGVYTEGEYPETPVTVPDTGYVGASYEATKELEYGGAEYTFVSGDTTIDRLSENAEGNVLNLYYERTVDDRADASVRVDHVYRTHSWVLENGTYDLVTSSVTEKEVESSTGLKATTVYKAKTDPKAGYEKDFTYDAKSVNSITLQPGENVITLYFDYTEKEPDPVTITVKHHYTKTVTTIVNGEPVTEKEVDDVKTETLTIYKGENKTLTEQKVYNKETYTSDGNNAEKLNLTNVQTNTTVDLFYTLVQQPEKTSVTVNHIYRTITHETVVTTDENGEVTGTEVNDLEPVVDSTDSAEVPDLYVGQSYQAPKVGKDGYTFNKEESDALTATVLADGATTIDLYYDRDEDEDNRVKADISVQHVYVTHLTAVFNGEVDTKDFYDGDFTEKFEMKAGDTFTAEPETTYKENEYTVVETPVLEKVLQPGTNSTIVIYYEREDSALGDPVPYQVKYVYKTYKMYVDTDGVARYAEPSTETGTIQTGEAVKGSGYVGQYVTIEGKPVDGFELEGTAPASQQTLAKEGNEWTFTYAKYEPLAQVNVTVKHHYTTTTIAVDGSSSSITADPDGTTVKKYVGESFVAAASSNGYHYDRYTITEGIEAAQDEASKNVTLTASADVTVDFYYSKVVNNSQPVSYKIRHIYKTIDWDGTEGTTEAKPIEGSSFATKQLSAATSCLEGYALTSATFNGTTIDGFDADDPQETYAVTLVSGENNEIIYTYVSKVDTREDKDVSVKVLHKYFARDTYTADASLTDEAFIASEGIVPEYTVEQVVTGRDNGVWIGTSYTAVKQLTYTVGEGEEAQTLTYTFVNAEPDNLTVELSETGEYEITINYIREYSTDPGDAQYTVVHEYYSNGSLVGSTTTKADAKVGAVVSAADIAKVTTYNGNSYSYTGATPESITVSDDGSSAITLHYSRTVYVPPYTPGPGSDPDPDPDTDPLPPVVIPDVEPPLAEIPEEDVPLTDAPEDETPLEELPDEDVPLTEIPETGDAMALYTALSILSGMGLAGLGLTSRKRKEEDAE